jgi:hypothetical protein
MSTIYQTKHFKIHELVDRKTFEEMGESAFTLFDINTLCALDDLREFFALPITVNNWFWGGEFEWRGYRTPLKAIELKAPRSMHRFGRAFDLDIKGVSAEEARKIIMENQDHNLLKIITRLEDGRSWVHFDTKVLPPSVKRIHLFLP